MGAQVSPVFMYCACEVLFTVLLSGTLTVEREELETHLKKTYSDATREIPLEETTGLVWPAAPGIKFDSNPPSLQEVIAVVNKARAKSALGPNGVPYLLYKRCPNVLKKLHKILRSAWNNIKISKEWITAEGMYIPKEQDSRGINQFRPILLLNVEVAEQQIPTVSQEPVKSLGRWYDSSMKDTRQGAETLEIASESLLAINKCILQGKFKI
ncbi:polyprotein [Plakobranchus ocellatus]|uniref:Polyprotein n=1 Tax=Plakobranchus ocellatus TaxID=259542 RepID=A0AAV4BQX1_9GAST|nr:polyprotein [Plakobranchus ocellatus]